MENAIGNFNLAEIAGVSDQSSFRLVFRDGLLFFLSHLRLGFSINSSLHQFDFQRCVTTDTVYVQEVPHAIS